MNELSLDSALQTLRISKKNPLPIDCDKYWQQINDISAKEHAAFSKEEDNLAMTEYNLHRCYSL
jgi:hypothetical protein